MKITVDVPNAHIDNALAGPASHYWANEAAWTRYPDGPEGYVVEDGIPPARHTLGSAKLKTALTKMADEFPARFGRIKSGDSDALDGDVLLQLMAFGEVKYS